MATLASFPGSPRTGSDGKLGGAWERGYGNPIPRPRKMKNDRIRKWQQMFLKNENLQFTSLLPVPVKQFLLLKSWTFATEHYKITPRFFLLFLHSHVKPTLWVTVKFVEATDTNCRCQSNHALTTRAKWQITEMQMWWKFAICFPISCSRGTIAAFKMAWQKRDFEHLQQSITRSLQDFFSVLLTFIFRTDLTSHFQICQTYWH